MKPQRGRRPGSGTLPGNARSAVLRRKKAMESGWFDRPVSIRTEADGSARDVINTRQAAEILLHRWPAGWDRQHRAARAACLAVLKGLEAPAHARRAFAAAAREADILREDEPMKDIRMAETQNLPFERAVTVSDPVGTIEIGSVREARDYLQNVEWPNGPAQGEALDTAQAALDGTQSAGDARDRFVDAARQAGVLVFE
jgi:hypothetical protein